MIISRFRASSRHSLSPCPCHLFPVPLYSLSSASAALAHLLPSQSPLHRYREVVKMTRPGGYRETEPSADKAILPMGAVGECANLNTVTMGCRTPNRTRTHSSSWNSSEDTDTHIPANGQHGHDGHDHGGGLIETLQSGGAHLSHSHLCVCYDAHTRHILSQCLPFLSLAIYCLVSYREGDRGSQVTLVGLGVNVMLTSAKGAAGWYMNSAALLADGDHSLSCKYALPTSCPFSKRCCVTVCALGWALSSPPLACVPGAKPSQLTC